MFGVLTELRRYAAGVPPTAVGCGMTFVMHLIRKGQP